MRQSNGLVSSRFLSHSHTFHIMKKVLPSILVIFFVTRIEGSPLLGCSGVTPPTTTTGKNYEIFNLTLPWYEAQIYCRERNMDLASIRSPEENEFFLTMLHVEGVKCTVDSVWLGGTILHSERGYFWMSDSKPVIYTNWQVGEPDDLNGNEKCLSVRCFNDNWQWNDWPCGNAYQFACERSP